MGPKTSKHPELQTQNLSSTDKEPYSNNARVYATWNHGGPLVSSDGSRITTKEIQNFQKHHQTTSSSSPASQISIEQKKPPTSSSNNYVERRKPRNDQNLQKPKLAMKKSQSMENITSKTTFITAEQLLYGQSKPRERNQSPSQISRRSDQNSTISKSSSSSTVNQIPSKTKRKKVPNDFTFVSINPKDLQVNYTNLFLLIVNTFYV